MSLRLDIARCSGHIAVAPDGVEWQPCCLDCQRRVKTTAQTLLLREQPLIWQDFQPVDGRCDGRIGEG